MNVIDNFYGWLRAKACQQLHIPHMDIWLTLDFFDEHGKLLKHRRQRSKSWTRNAYNYFHLTLSSHKLADDIHGAGYLSFKNTDGLLNISDGTWFSGGDIRQAGDGYRALGEYTTHGIVVGRGGAAESFEDYRMSTTIAAGNGTNQLFTPEGEEYTVSYNAGTKVWTSKHLRYFNNNSGASISLTNVGLIGDMRRLHPFSNMYVLFSRDVLDPSETIVDKAQLKVEYEMSLTFPA